MLTSNWWIVSIIIVTTLIGLGALTTILWQGFLADNSLVGGLITAYEVGVTPKFVDFRNFKVERFRSITLYLTDIPTIVVCYNVASRGVPWRPCNNQCSCLAPVSFSVFNFIFLRVSLSHVGSVCNFPLRLQYCNSHSIAKTQDRISSVRRASRSYHSTHSSDRSRHCSMFALFFIHFVHPSLTHSSQVLYSTSSFS